MVLSFDIRLFCENLKATKPPYECPVEGCGKVYKSFCGIQFHMYNYDHDNPDTNSPSRKPNKKNTAKQPLASWHHRAHRRSPTPPQFFRSPNRETLTYAEAQRLVEVDFDGRIHRINIYEPLEIIVKEEIENIENVEKEENDNKEVVKTPLKPAKCSESNKGRKEVILPPTPAAASPPPPSPPPPPLPAIKFPEAHFHVLEDYIAAKNPVGLPESYYRYIEKSAEELDEEVEYDMDEEDHSWLVLVNERRHSSHNAEIKQEQFELLMDRFEKEAFFQSQSSGNIGPPIDEDAVCTICMDGECQNSNVILFCDMCNLPVHQECYGVPYIPEGQWLCRRCLQSPSCAVDCCLCPNKGGAFKQTDDSRWAHVVCALWIPEVGFANTVFLEPIDSMCNIPSARWKLSCYICKQRGTGACIQCHKTNCYTAFHVTCAQQAGLYMKIEPVRDPANPTAAISVRKTAFCDVHTPADSECTPMVMSDDSPERSNSAKKDKAKSRIKMRKARKILAEKRNAMPVVSIPMIPEQRLTKIAALVDITRKNNFLSQLISYWTLKRKARNGVPLLRRLQSSHMTRNKDQTKNDRQSAALRAQLKYWQRLRQDLEKARLLVELIRKRERLKREKMRLFHVSTELQLQPFVVMLRKTLEELQEKDTSGIFSEPVPLKEVPDYLSYIEKPMDLSTMRKLVESHHYKTVSEFEADFDLILNNCMKYNSKETSFYRAAVRFRDQGGVIMRACYRMFERIGFDSETGLHLDAPPKQEEPVILEDYDAFLQTSMDDIPLENQLKILLDKMDLANSTLNGVKRTHMAKMLRKEIVKVRRKLILQRGEGGDCSDEESVNTGDSEPRPLSPVGSRKSVSHTGTSPEKRASSSSSSGNKTPATSKSATPGTGRGRGRGRSSARQKSESETDVSVGKSATGCSDEPNAKCSRSAAALQDDSKCSGTPPSTPGVNRRTAILFNKRGGPGRSVKAGTDTESNTPMSASSTGTQTLRRGPGRPPKPKQLSVPFESGDDHPPVPCTRVQRSASTSSNNTPTSNKKQPATITATPTAAPIVTTPIVAGKRKRRTASTASASVSTSTDTSCPSPPKQRAISVSERPVQLRLPEVISTAIGGPDDVDIARNSDSFTRYRTERSLSSSESDTTSEFGTTDESLSDTSSTSGSESKSRLRRRSGSEDVIPLEPLDLVWAKCRGYPWYPALIINPKMPKTGYFHNGVPIPVPPDEVLVLQKKYEEHVYLVLFFDTKRTWQWLPRGKLEPLGVDSALDKSKLLENKKPNVRKAVRKAYEKAILHRCSVTGEPNPLSGESSGED